MQRRSQSRPGGVGTRHQRGPQRRSDGAGGEIHTTPLPETDPARLGLAGTAHTFVPNPLQGSRSTPGSAWFATDVIPHKYDPQERVRAALLLYRLEFGE